MITNPFHYALSQMEAPPGRALWIYGEPDIALGDVYQPWKDKADIFQRKGCHVISDIEEIESDYDSVFVNCPKQHEEAQGLMALALQHSTGFVMASAPGGAGGGRLAGMMDSYGLKYEQLSKSRCKIVWTIQAKQASKKRINENIAHLKPRRLALEEEQWWTLPGLFGWNKIDTGSRLLLEHLPANLSGRLADFGCGYGYLSVMAERRYPALGAIDAYDADARAVACCTRNAGGKVNAIWQDIRVMVPKRHYDVVLMNPPFHTGKQEDLALGQNFIGKAWQSLKPGGQLFLVANRNLPYEKVVSGIHILTEKEGYKIMTARAS